MIIGWIGPKSNTPPQYPADIPVDWILRSGGSQVLPLYRRRIRPHLFHRILNAAGMLFFPAACAVLRERKAFPQHQKTVDS
jgi:hypothetical protein